MKVLYLVPYTPTPIRARPYHLLRTLVQRGDQVTLATVWEHEADLQLLQEIESWGVRVLSVHLSRSRLMLNMGRAFFSANPLQARYSWHPQLADLITDALKTDVFDVVQVEHLRGAAYGLHAQAVLRRAGSKTLVVWDSVDCISLLFDLASRSSRSFFGRWVTRFELPRTRKMEAHLLRHFDLVLVTAARDREAFVRLAGAGKPLNHLRVLPNGVDLSYFSPNGVMRSANTVIFSGKMSYHANLSAALFLVQEVMPLVWRTYPEVQIQLVGKDPPDTLLRLAQQDPRVEVTGTVPDLRPYLQRATIAIAPILYGVGIQNKVLEAMACGTPVVASAQAVSALSVESGRELMVGQNAVELADAVCRLLADSDLRAAIGSAGRAYVQEHHDWHKLVGQLEAWYGEVVGAVGG